MVDRTTYRSALVVVVSVLMATSMFVGTVTLSGTASAQEGSVSFGADTLEGADVQNPSSLQFGPDGRLYVAERYGEIHVLDVTRNGPNDYEVTSSETITTVQNLPNHNDQGEYQSGENRRQITGLVVGGTADNPVFYVSSSDPRVGGGGSGEDLNLDTNSGVISKLTPTDGGWDHEMLVRGLPRSEENHATNGLELSADGNTLYVAQGGHANKGAPSNNFAYTPEYALSAAILEIDLGQVEGMSTKNAEHTDVPYRYDLPTLNGTDAPFGGQDGKNMAKLVQGGPVSVHSPGYRNPYDVTMTEDGQLYTFDNGANSGWGGTPVNEGEDGVCTNEPNEENSDTTSDNLHLVTEGSYGGHPNPVRGNPDGVGLYDENGTNIGSVADAVYDGYDNPVECDYQSTDDDGSLTTISSSTNGLDEYTASNFSGAMQGDLLTAAFDGNVYRVQLNDAGTSVTSQSQQFSADLSTPLDVTTQGDSGPFPGTVWVADFGGDDINVFEPTDSGDGGGGATCDVSDLQGDADGDGFTNGDEQDAGTDPCSAASVPNDNDGDGDPDTLDNDDDNDGLSDTEDPFAVDSDNGLSTALPVEYNFSAGSQPNSLEGIGFTGLMTNGQDYQDLYVPDDAVFGGASPILTQEVIKNGDAYQGSNSQQHAYQFGIDPPSEPFVISAPVTGYPNKPNDFQSAGIQLGTGDQDNYVKLVVSANDGTGGVEFVKETSGIAGDSTRDNNPAVRGEGAVTDLYMTVYPSNNTVVASYAVDGGETTNVGKTTIPDGWLSNQVNGQDVGLATGVISTSFQASEFSATWEDFSVTPLGSDGGGDGSAPTADAGTDTTVEEGTEVTLDGSGSSDPNGDQLGYSWTQTSGPDVSLSSQDAPSSSFDAPEVDGTATLTFELSVSDGESSATDTVEITIEDTDGSGGSATSADVTVNANSGNIDASTFNAGSFTIENTGDTAIESATIDLSESTLPDAVFDPEGTAGDSGSKGFEVDGGVGGTTEGTFTQPHNGEDGADGYDALDISFTDFGPGETLTFSTDIDPTSIKNVDGTGGAGSVSGLELAGSSVTVQSVDASVTNDLSTDGSQGGSQANVAGVPADAPTLGVQGATLESTDFPAHSAATVGDAQQTLTVSGPAGATVEVLHFVGNPAPENGYDIDAYEADSAQSVETQMVELDANGEGTLDVSLTDGSLDYFVAAVENGDANGRTSGTVILELGEETTNQPPVADAGANQTVAEESTVTLDASNSTDPDDDALSYEWTQTGSGPSVSLSDASSATSTFTAPDVDSETTLTFEVAVSDGNGGSATDSVAVTVTPTDDAAPTISDFALTNPSGQTLEVGFDSDEALANIAVEVTDGSDNAVATLDESDFSSSAGTYTATVEVSGPGEYTATLVTAADAAGNDGAVGQSDSATIEAPNGAPTAAFSYSPQEPQAGEEVAFDASGSSDDSAIASYEWDFNGDGAVDATGQQVSHTYDSAGEYTVELTVTDDEGATATTTRRVSASEAPPENQGPSASFTVSPSSPVSGEPASFDASGSSDSDGSIAIYSWDFGDGTTTTGATPSHTYENSGTYTVALTVTDDDGATNTAAKSVTVGGSGEETPDENVLTIVGTGSVSEYTFSVNTSDVEKSTANDANINGNDEVRRGYVADGEVGISADSYTFTGTLETLGVDGDAEVYLNGDRISGEQLDDYRDNVIEFAGTGSAAQYDFAATNADVPLQKVTANNANVNGNDDIWRTTANGEVGISKDAYGFDGVIDSLDVDGNAEVYVNGRQVNPDDEQDNMITIVGTGERANYQFTTEDGMARSTANFANLNGNDEAQGETASGVVGISADSFDYDGDISDFDVSEAVRVYVDGEQVGQDDVATEP